jgi:hypothetical protein
MGGHRESTYSVDEGSLLGICPGLLYVPLSQVAAQRYKKPLCIISQEVLRRLNHHQQQQQQHSKNHQLRMFARSNTLTKIVTHNIQFVLTHNQYASRGEEIIKVVKGGDVGLCKYNTVASQVS